LGDGVSNYPEDIDQEIEEEITKEKTIEAIAVNHQRVSKITNLEGFINLRKVSIIDNEITKVEGLQKCKLLEELSLEKNKI
jgi:Leucine-rich repeat (LRR) protein